jgi:hypothetical protein
LRNPPWLSINWLSLQGLGIKLMALRQIVPISNSEYIIRGLSMKNESKDFIEELKKK